MARYKRSKIVSMKAFKVRIIIGLLVALAWLPLSVLFVFSNLAYLVIYHLWRYRLKVVRKNLRNAFPDYSDNELLAIERQFYHHFCDLMAEELKLLNMSDKERERRIVIKGVELIEQAAAEGRPAFVYGGHIGNWEWTPDISSRVKPPLTKAAVYETQRNTFSDDGIKQLRERTYPGVFLFSQKKAARALLNLKETYGSFQLWLISDQCPPHHRIVHWATFLNQDTPYISGGEAIGRKLNAKFLMAHVTKPRRGYYEVNVRNIQPTPEEFANQDGYPYSLAFMRMLEENIREQPEIYLWTHNRWKYRRAFNPDGTWKVIDTRRQKDNQLQQSSCQ